MVASLTREIVDAANDEMRKVWKEYIIFICLQIFEDYGQVFLQESVETYI